MNHSRRMTPEFLEWLIIGIACAAVATLVWQYRAASAEFRALATRFGRKPWAKKLLKLGPCLAERTQWTLAKAWGEAMQRGVLTPEEIDDAVLALAELPGGEALILEPGEAFDDTLMEADGEKSPWVFCTIRSGLVWRGATLRKARVRTAPADAVLLSSTAEHPLTARILGLLGEKLGPGTRITRGAVNGALESVSRPEERNAWLRELNAKAPAGSFTLIEPTEGDPFDGGTMESAEPLSAPQHAVVAGCRCVGLRRVGTKGEVLAHALVVARAKPREERI